MLDRRSFLRPRSAPRRPGGLAPFEPSPDQPWNEARARHLLRRTTYGVHRPDVDALLALSPAEAVDLIVDGALARPPLDRPDWLAMRRYPASATTAEKQAFEDANRAASEAFGLTVYNRLLGDAQTDRAARLGESFLERLTVFWSNRYVTETNAYRFAWWLFDYRDTLRRNALGSVATAVHEIGTTGAMLRYLNGDDNRKEAPNENYARELLELFTMGITGPDGTPNYTQSDVTEIARALTGWRLAPWQDEDVYFDARRFDDGDKTLLGETGAFGYDDVVPILFRNRPTPIAHHVATALYREFVSLEVDADVVADLARRLVAAEFQVAPVLRTLLASSHFFEATHMGALIKSPTELLVGAARTWGRTAYALDDAKRANYQAKTLDQDLFSPPDVKGWRGGRDWINTSTITERAKLMRGEVWRARDAIIADARARDSAFDARALAAGLYEELLLRPPEASALDDLTEVLLQGTPAYAWDPTTDGGGNRIRSYVAHLVSLPDFQLR